MRRVLYRETALWKTWAYEDGTVWSEYKDGSIIKKNTKNTVLLDVWIEDLIIR